MKAVILAAGQGKRLGRLNHHRPKCLLNLGPTTIIEHQIANLRLHDITDITVVVGYRAEQVKHWLGDSVHYICNPDYAATNSLYSLWLARGQAEDGFVLLNGDVVFHPQILGKLLASPYPDALTIDRESEFDDEQMKVALDGDRVVAISKELDAGVAAGENLGVVKFSRSGARVLFEKIEALIAQGGADRWCPYAFDAIAPYQPIYGIDIGDLPWIEIDFPTDLMKAVRSIYPKIEQSPWIGVDDPGDLWYAQTNVYPWLHCRTAGVNFHCPLTAIQNVRPMLNRKVDRCSRKI
ncbi:MAG: phosphocholine cytidylyltransferase family protein [Acidobacteria bacterium]|nr:phosphocholine cytidylyltransferase family protein [Acidobacteriota bacterium]